MLTTTKLRKILQIAEEYNYEGAVDWMLPFVSIQTAYESMLRELKVGGETAGSLISLDEEAEIKDHRLQLLELYQENIKEQREIEERARALDIVDPVYNWSRPHCGTRTPESKILWDKASTIPTYQLERKALNLPIKLSSFDEIGKAIRAGIRILGKPNYFQTTYSGRDTNKNIGWRKTSVEEILKLRRELLRVGIRKFYIYQDKYYLRLIIKIPTEVFPEAFYTSEDPKKWKELQEKKEDRVKVKKVTKKLDKES